MKKTIILSAAAFVLAACCSQPKFDGPTYLNPNAPVEDRVEDALSRMTLEEKVGMTTAQSKFSSRGVPRLGIPEVWHTDVPGALGRVGPGRMDKRLMYSIPCFDQSCSYMGQGYGSPLWP